MGILSRANSPRYNDECVWSEYDKKVNDHIFPCITSVL
jgi:hypothetical protein